MKSESENKKESPSVRVMRLLEKIEKQKWNPYDIDKYAAAAVFFLVLSLLVCYFQIGFSHVEEDNGYHKEILPSESLSYIKDGQLVSLLDGVYPVAMPSQDSTIEINGEKVFPLLLVFVPKSDADSTKIEDFDATKQDELKKQLKDLLNSILGAGSVYDVYITSFLLQ